VSLVNLWYWLSAAGRPQEGIAPIAEAVDLYSRLAKADPVTYLPKLAQVLNVHGCHLSQLGRHKKALVPAQKAVQLYLRLIDNSDTHMPDLALAMANLGDTLSGLGRRKESAAMLQEAAAIRRFLETSQATRPTR